MSSFLQIIYKIIFRKRAEGNINAVIFKSTNDGIIISLLTFYGHTHCGRIRTNAKILQRKIKESRSIVSIVTIDDILFLGSTFYRLISKLSTFRANFFCTLVNFL